MKFGKWKKLKNIEDKTHRFPHCVVMSTRVCGKTSSTYFKLIFYEILTFIQLHSYEQVTDMC